MNCRMRRQQHKESLEVQVDSLKKDNLQLQSERDFYKNQLKNCRCNGSGNESSLELPPSATGPAGSYPHHSHHHPLVAVHPQQLDLSVNPVSVTSHEDFKRIYPGGPHELKVQPNMNAEDYKKHLELSSFSAHSVMSGSANGREHLDIKILSNDIEGHKM